MCGTAVLVWPCRAHDTLSRAPNPPRLGQVQRSDQRQETMRVAAPCYTRPQSDEWLCSLRLGVLEGGVKSRALMRAFGWDRPVPAVVLAVQLLSLSKKFEVGWCLIFSCPLMNSCLLF